LYFCPPAGAKLMYIKLITYSTEYRKQKIMYIKLTMYLFFIGHLALRILMQANPLLGQLALEMYLPASKSLRTTPYKQKVH
jgi:hypothetical protein